MPAFQGLEVRRMTRWAAQRIFPGGAILLYHRVAERTDDPHGLIVSPGNFEEHLEVLRGRVRPLAEVSPAVGEPRTSAHALSITFDDGYADVAETALPLLERHETPASVFVTTGAVDGNGHSWWASWGSSDTRALAQDEILRLGESPLIELGAHSVTHPRLPALTPEEQNAEMRASRDYLEALLGRPVRSFSYPHGLHDRTTRTLLRQAGFCRACTSSAAVVRASTDPLRLPRLRVPDLDGDRFEGWLARWGL